jgi:competence protein ComEC
MKRPLASFTIIFCLGIFAVGLLRVNFFWAYLFASLFFILALLLSGRANLFGVLFACLSFLLGAVLFKNAQVLPLCHIFKQVPYRSDSVYMLKGFITSEPEVKGARTSFTFRAEELQSQGINRSCCGSIMVSLKNGQSFYYAEGLILKGKLHRPFGQRGSRRQSYGEYLRNRGIRLIMNVSSPMDVLKLNKNKGILPVRLALWLKHKAQVIIYHRLPPLSAAILDAMLLGDRSGIPPFINSSMIKTGTVHILVVSGFNVGIVAFMLLLFLKLLRLPRRARFYIAITPIVIYCLMTGSSNPVLRSTVMAIIFMLGGLLKRQPDIYNSLSIAVLFILAASPGQLFDIGFQLSFASVLSIVYLYPKIRSFLLIERLKIKIIRLVLEGCLVSFSAWVGTMGLVAYYFKVFSPVTVLANLFIVPLASLITLCGFSLVFVSLVCPPLAQFFASTSAVTIMLLVNLNRLFLKLPLAYFYLP